jgi:type I restriction enzyme S subunit
MKEWKSFQLGEIYNVSSGLSKSKDSFGHGEVFISFKDVFYNWFLPKEPIGLVNSSEKDQNTCSVLKGDVLITRTSETSDEIGMTSVALKDYTKSTFNGFCKRLRIKEDSPIQISPSFIGYLFRSRNFRKTVAQYSTMTTRASLNGESIKKMAFNFPSFEEQKAIANILTAFDDKIENLQAQNKTLETTAQTIFKEWFGKYQIGDELPEGWRVGELGEVIKFINGYAFKSKDLIKEPIENSYKVFKMGDIKKGGGFNPSKTKGYFPKSLANKLDKYILKNGDLLMSMTDMKDAISLLGHTALMIYDNEYLVNQRVGLIRADNDKNISYPYLYLLTNNEDFIANLRAGANSGVQVNLSTQGIKDTEFIIADKKTNKSFDDLVTPFFEKRRNNSIEIKTLKQTRDTLLPMLMSGTLRVNDFKK